MKIHPLAFLRRLRATTRGVAMLEFALSLPIFLTLSLTGAETANWVITKMRVSQLALHVADNAARMGTGPLLAAKTVSETDINDVLTGAGLQSGELKLYDSGRVILSDLEPVEDTPGKYFIRWQRCRGSDPHASTYGTATTMNSSGVPIKQVSGIGPTGRQVGAQEDSATMFVEVYYKYRPLVSASLAPSTDFTEIASMAIRDRRDRSTIYNNEGATKSTC